MYFCHSDFVWLANFSGQFEGHRILPRPDRQVIQLLKYSKELEKPVFRVSRRFYDLQIDCRNVLVISLKQCDISSFDPTSNFDGRFEGRRFTPGPNRWLFCVSHRPNSSKKQIFGSGSIFMTFKSTVEMCLPQPKQWFTVVFSENCNFDGLFEGQKITPGPKRWFFCVSHRPNSWKKQFFGSGSIFMTFNSTVKKSFFSNFPLFWRKQHYKK